MNVKFEDRNAQKFRGHVTLATPPFRNILRGDVLETCTSVLKSVALTVSELLAFMI